MGQHFRHQCKKAVATLLFWIMPFLCLSALYEHEWKGHIAQDARHSLETWMRIEEAARSTLHLTLELSFTVTIPFYKYDQVSNSVTERSRDHKELTGNNAAEAKQTAQSREPHHGKQPKLVSSNPGNCRSGCYIHSMMMSFYSMLEHRPDAPLHLHTNQSTTEIRVSTHPPQLQ
jgi:hypothetical protein